MWDYLYYNRATSFLFPINSFFSSALKLQWHFLYFWNTSEKMLKFQTSACDISGKKMDANFMLAGADGGTSGTWAIYFLIGWMISFLGVMQIHACEEEMNETCKSGAIALSKKETSFWKWTVRRYKERNYRGQSNSDKPIFIWDTAVVGDPLLRSSHLRPDQTRTNLRCSAMLLTDKAGWFIVLVSWIGLRQSWGKYQGLCCQRVVPTELSEKV